MTLNEMIRARDSAAELLATLDPSSALFATHYKTWETFDETIQKMMAEGATA